MQINKRIAALENTDFTQMSDEKLERLAGKSHPAVNRWLLRLTDEDLETIIHAKPGCSALLATAPKEFFECR